MKDAFLMKETEVIEMKNENAALRMAVNLLQTQLDKAVSDYEYWRDKYLCEISNRQVCCI